MVTTAARECPVSMKSGIGDAVVNEVVETKEGKLCELNLAMNQRYHEMTHP
jgi:hypothetical protein